MDCCSSSEQQQSYFIDPAATDEIYIYDETPITLYTFERRRAEQMPGGVRIPSSSTPHHYMEAVNLAALGAISACATATRLQWIYVQAPSTTAPGRFCHSLRIYDEWHRYFTVLATDIGAPRPSMPIAIQRLVTLAIRNAS
jgi:hypothetical protein